MTDKVQLRKKILQLRQSQFTSQINKNSKFICEQLIQQDFFVKAKTIGLYDATPTEVQTKEIAKAARAMGKVCYYPKVVGKNLQFGRVDREFDFKKGFKGIHEPIVVESNVSLDIILVPAVAIDFQKRRLGQGGGFYDRYLQKNQSLKVGLIFNFQLLNQIPTHPHDITMDFIQTEKGTVT